MLTDGRTDGQTDRRTDGRTDGQTDWGIAIALSQIGWLGAKNRYFWAILANLTTSGRVFLTEMVKGHIYGPRPFI